MAQAADFSSMDWQERRQAVAAALESSPAGLSSLLIAILRDSPHDPTGLSAALSIIQEYKTDLVEELSALLSHEQPQVRMHAAQALGVLGNPAAVPALLQVLQHETNQNIRFNAVEALGRLRAGEAVDPLLEIAAHGSYFEQFAAVQALAEIGDPRSVPALTGLLHNAELAEAVIHALGVLGGPETTPVITRCLDNDSIPLAPVAQALGRLAERFPGAAGQPPVAAAFTAAVSPAGRARLLQGVLDHDPEALAADAQISRGLAYTAGWLYQLHPGDEEARSALVALLDYAETEDIAADFLARCSPRLEGWISDHLSESDSRPALAILRKLVNSPDEACLSVLMTALSSSDAQVITLAALGLARLGSPEILEQLLPFCGHPSPAVRSAVVEAVRANRHPNKRFSLAQLHASVNPLVRETVIHCLAGSPAAESAAVILSATADDEPAVRAAALRALPALNDPQAGSILADAVSDANPTIRAAAAQALGYLPAAAALPLLLQALQQSDMWTRLYACRSLGLLAQPESIPALVSALTDPLPPVRLAASEALQKIGSPEALAALQLNGPLDFNDEENNLSSLENL